MNDEQFTTYAYVVPGEEYAQTLLTGPNVNGQGFIETAYLGELLGEEPQSGWYDISDESSIRFVGAELPQE